MHGHSQDNPVSAPAPRPRHPRRLRRVGVLAAVWLTAVSLAAIAGSSLAPPVYAMPDAQTSPAAGPPQGLAGVTLPATGGTTDAPVTLGAPEPRRPAADSQPSGTDDMPGEDASGAGDDMGDATASAGSPQSATITAPQPMSRSTQTQSPSCQVDLTTLGGLNRPPGCWRPYAATSPFNIQLPANPQLVANSPAIVSRLLGFGSIEDLVAGKAETANNDYGRPVYFASATDPLYTIHCTEPWGTCAIEGATIHIPQTAQHASGSDGHMSVVDTATGIEYDFWGTGTLPAPGGTLDIAWGGSTSINGNGLGSAATAADFGTYAGIVRLEELQSGQINHALFMYATCDSGTYVYPAAKSGQSCAAIGQSNTNAPPMGTRFQLNMTDAQIAALSVPAWKKTILTAMAHYGLIMGDTGSIWGIKEESADVYTSFGAPDKWLAWAQTQPGVTSWNGLSYFDLAGGVDWQSRLRVIAPCVSQATC
jgi:hypothetical protein